jgi:hypothetical protein
MANEAELDKLRALLEAQQRYISMKQRQLLAASVGNRATIPVVPGEWDMVEQLSDDYWLVCRPVSHDMVRQAMASLLERALMGSCDLLGDLWCARAQQLLTANDALAEDFVEEFDDD